MSLGTDTTGLGRSFWTDVRPTDGRNLDSRPQIFLKMAFLGALDGLEFATTEASFFLTSQGRRSQILATARTKMPYVWAIVQTRL